MSVLVKLKQYYTVELLSQHTDKVFLFGDNLAGYGKGGQAIIRDCPNAFGIPTKKLPSMQSHAFMSDDEFEANKKAIDKAFNLIPKNKIIVVPADGLGTGRAQLKSRAPQTFRYIKYKLNKYPTL
tara:strand:+ start:45 stop:419 length:375 start_codon:yes stop_codon:yes gene_type:complete